MIVNQINLSPYSFHIQYDDFNIAADISFDLPDESVKKLEMLSSAFASEGEIERFEKAITKTVADFVKSINYTNAQSPYGRDQRIRKQSKYSIGSAYPFAFPQGIEEMGFVPDNVKYFQFKKKWNWEFDVVYKGNGKWVVTDISFAPQLRLTHDKNVSSRGDLVEDGVTDHSSKLSYLNLRGQSIVAGMDTSPIDIEYALDKSTLNWLEKTVASCASEGEIEQFDRSVRKIVRTAVHELAEENSINTSIGDTVHWQHQDWEAMKKYELTFTVPNENRLILTRIKTADL